MDQPETLSKIKSDFILLGVLNFRKGIIYILGSPTGRNERKFFETYVVSEIVKSYYNAGKQPNPYYYRDIDQRETDLLISSGDKLYPIEIKKAKSPVKPDKNFRALEKFRMDIQPGIIICMSEELVPYNRNVWYFPVSAL